VSKSTEGNQNAQVLLEAEEENKPSAQTSDNSTLPSATYTLELMYREENSHVNLQGRAMIFPG